MTYLLIDHRQIVGVPICRLHLLVLISCTFIVPKISVCVWGSLVSKHVTSNDETKPVSIFDDQSASALASDLLAMQHGTRKLGRIDTHHHYVPDFYATYLDKHGESDNLIIRQA